MTGDPRPQAVPPRFEAAIHEGAASASDALSRWLGREARISVSRARLADVTEAVEALGPGDALVAACAIPLEGPAPGTILMSFEERSAMAMVDALLGRAEGTATDWGEIERSAAQETANIVACAFVNALAEGVDADGPLVPGPPEFRLEFAASLLEFAVIDQAMRGDRIVLIETRFAVGGVGNDWSLVIVPTSEGREAFGIGPGPGESRSEP